MFDSMTIRDSVFVSADAPVRSPQNLVIYNMKVLIMGSKYPAHSSFDFENKITDQERSSSTKQHYSSGDIRAGTSVILFS